MTYNNINKNFKKAQLKKAQLKKAQLKKAFSLIELSVVVLIIGILIAGITAGSRLVRNSKLASAAQFTKSSDVNSIPDLVLWLEPTQENSFATTSSNTSNSTYDNLAKSTDSANYVKDTLRPDNREYVARWNDINPRAVAGNKKSVYQEIATQRPMYIANAINGLPAIQFDGSTQYLYSQNNTTTPSAPPLTEGDRTTTMIAVFTTNSNATTLDRTMIMDQFVGFSSSQASAREMGMAFNSNINTTPNRLYLLTWNSDPYSVSTDNMPINVGAPNIAIITADDNVFDVSSNIRMCLNGKCITPSNPNSAPYSYGSGVVWNPASDTFALATRAYNGSKNILNGYIGEVMVFDRALKNEEIDIINKYLSKKWGIALK